MATEGIWPIWSRLSDLIFRLQRPKCACSVWDKQASSYRGLLSLLPPLQHAGYIKVIREIFGKEIDKGLNSISLETVKLFLILDEQPKNLVIGPKEKFLFWKYIF